MNEEMRACEGLLTYGDNGAGTYLAPKPPSRGHLFPACLLVFVLAARGSETALEASEETARA